MTISRRDFLRLSCCSAAVGMASNFSKFGLINAMAAPAADYKALVCIFMFGGNDANNMVVPLGSADYGSYARIRGGLALPQASLLPVMPPSAGVPFGLHPNLPELQSLFNQKKLAMLSNVGVLVRPVTRAQYLARTVVVPSHLFSHADQQAQWQTSIPVGLGDTGWAGRTADKIEKIYGKQPFPTVVSVAGTNIFCAGVDTRPATVSPGSSQALSGFDGSAESNARFSALQQLLTFDTGISLIQAASGTTTNALKNGEILAAALASVSPLATAFPTTDLGKQLAQVAKLIQVRSALGLKRQIFFCSLQGFDTHSDQLNHQQNLYSNLAPAMAAFDNATTEMGVESQVSSFTLSDFGRTYLPASGGGTDHAWGSHQFIMGGAVQGGDFYGTFPTLALGGPDDTGDEGRWIPTTSLDQYAATLASWFGVPAADLPSVFPNLGNFANPTLKFLG